MEVNPTMDVHDWCIYFFMTKSGSVNRTYSPDGSMVFGQRNQIRSQMTIHRTLLIKVLYKVLFILKITVYSLPLNV